MKGIHKFTKKEKTLFWTAILIGFSSGIVGNIFANSLWQIIILLVGNNYWAYLIILLIASLVFWYLVNFIVKKIEDNRPNIRK